MIDFKKQIKISTRTWLIIILIIIISPYVVFLFSGGFNTNETYQAGSLPNVNNEYGSSLTDCLQKADSWLVGAKKTAEKVLVEEKTKKNPYQDFIDQHTSSESEIMGSLQAELVNYKKECNRRF